MNKVILFFVSCILALSCSKETNQTKLRLALDWTQNPNHIPLFVGKSLGYFREQGIELSIFKPNSEDSLYHVETGNADLALSYLPRALRTIAQKHNHCIVGRIIEKPLNGFLFLEESGIKTHEDLNGKNCGFSWQRYSLPIFERLLSEKNIHLGEKFNVGENLIGALASKYIDVAYGVMRNVQPVQMRAQNYNVNFFSVVDFGVPEYEGLVVVAKANFRHDPQLLAGFQQALQKSIDFCRQNPEIAFEIYVGELQDKSPKNIKWQEKSWHETIELLATSQNFSSERVNDHIQWLVQKGYMQKSVDFDSAFYTLASN